MKPEFRQPASVSGATPEPAQERNLESAPADRLPSSAEAEGGLGNNSSATVPPILPDAIQQLESVIVEKTPVPSVLRRLVFAPLKFVLGMASCQSVLGSLAVIGWSYRLMQRTVLKHWWNQSRPSGSFVSFADFVAADSRTRAHLHWPNWFLAQNFREAVRRPPDAGFAAHLRTVLKALLHSLWINVRTGVQGIFNTWVLTLPGCVLWLFAWYAGWQNSFNKGYEQAWIGPTIGFVGVVLFIVAMLYVPLAQARHAVTGNWRQFYDFRLVWTLVRRRWPACLGLAALYSICSAPILILASAVTFLPQINPKLSNLTNDQLGQTLDRYFFGSAAFVFPAFVLLRWMAARIYAATLLKAVQTGAVFEDALGEAEWQVLLRLSLLRVQSEPRRHPVVRAIAWAGTRAGRITFGFAAALVWFTFVAQIFIRQFFNYLGAEGWLNQPLVQLPWFHHLPDALTNPWGEVFVAAVAVFVAWRLKKLVSWLRALWRRSEPQTP